MPPVTPRSLDIGDRVYFVPEFMDRLREEINPLIDFYLSRYFFTVKAKDPQEGTVTFKSAYQKIGDPDEAIKRQFTWSDHDPIVKSKEDRDNIDSILQDLQRICRLVHAYADPKNKDYNATEAKDVFAGMKKEVQDIIRDCANNIRYDEITGDNAKYRREILGYFRMVVGGRGLYVIEEKRGYVGYRKRRQSRSDILRSMPK